MLNCVQCSKAAFVQINWVAKKTMTEDALQTGLFCHECAKSWWERFKNTQAGQTAQFALPNCKSQIVNME